MVHQLRDDGFLIVFDFSRNTPMNVYVDAVMSLRCRTPYDMRVMFAMTRHGRCAQMCPHRLRSFDVSYPKDRLRPKPYNPRSYVVILRSELHME